MTITHHGQTYRVSEVDLLEQAIRDAGCLFVPRREWLQYHADRKTPLNAVLIACGVSPVASRVSA